MRRAWPVVIAAALAAGAAPARADDGPEAKAPPHALRLAAGVAVGAPFPLTLGAVLRVPRADGRAGLDVDAAWSPSRDWQSYDVGGAYHPFGNPFFVGARLRLLQLHPPWSRGFDAAFDDQPAVGVELGARGWLDGGRRLLGSVTVSATAVPSTNTSLPVFYTLSAGLAYDVWARAR